MKPSTTIAPYGTAVHAEELISLIDHILAVNIRAEAAGKRKTPLCIWGQHGIGKTELVEAYARNKGYQWSYVAPAQFEEMGDLLGMPAIHNGQTVFAPPAWVPTEEGPGILLIDDVNRADDRILRGIMQLLQQYELASWKLPRQWHILLTANPDDGHYSVTPMDDALLTRMMHVQMTFDAEQWARWAGEQDIDFRCILFVLANPDLMQGRRTTPRTLVQFFEAISGIEDLAKQASLIQTLGDACLDPETVADFIDFIDKGLWDLPAAAAILNSNHFYKDIEIPIKNLINRQSGRSDILFALNSNLVNYLLQHTPNNHQLENLKAYILMDVLPPDLRLLMAQQLAASNNPILKTVLALPEIGKLLIG